MEAEKRREERLKRKSNEDSTAITPVKNR